MYVYDDACKAGLGIGNPLDSGDIDGDCITNLSDYVPIAEEWLVDYNLTVPIVKP